MFIIIIFKDKNRHIYLLIIVCFIFATKSINERYYTVACMISNSPLKPGFEQSMPQIKNPFEMTSLVLLVLIV